MCKKCAEVRDREAGADMAAGPTARAGSSSDEALVQKPRLAQIGDVSSGTSEHAIRQPGSLSPFSEIIMCHELGERVLQCALAHPPPWTPSHHFGACGQSCPCCREAAGEWAGGCDFCAATAAMGATSRAVRAAVEKEWTGEGFRRSTACAEVRDGNAGPAVAAGLPVTATSTSTSSQVDRRVVRLETRGNLD